ncbi:UvrD-helicase domain-containing protein, partial [bacterium]|nr:UvrD-helicase domain-containing protein [bacterium]
MIVEYTVLINDEVKKILLSSPHPLRSQIRKAFEYLEAGLWEGGIRVKKLRGQPAKVIFEARMNRGDRILFTLGRALYGASHHVLIYVWSIISHDDISRSAKKMIPADAPFLQFEPFHQEDLQDLELSCLNEDYITQEPLESRAIAEDATQRWFVLDDQEWERLLLYSKDHFEMHLFLSNEQADLLNQAPPVLISGTAGSGKTTLCVYYLLRPELKKSSRLLVTYNKYLRDFCKRIYSGLLKHHPESNEIRPPSFYTFKELCFAILGNSSKYFPSEKEMDATAFQQAFRRSRFSQEFDPVLVWEEIRSIIKGSKPPIRSADFGALLKNWPRKIMEESNISTLKEYLIGLSQLSIGNQVNHVVMKLLNLDLHSTASSLSSLLQSHPDRLEKALISISGLVNKHEGIFTSPLMTFAEYDQIGKKRAPLFTSNREEIYPIAQWYQIRLKEDQMWDEIDLTRAAILKFDQNDTSLQPFDFMACDEVQDLTDIQLSLLMRLIRNQKNILFAGDTKQIVNPSGFRWEEAKRLFHDRALPVPKLQHLTTNFRSVGSIVMLSNALLQLKTDLLGIKADEKLDLWKFPGPTPVVLEDVRESDLASFVQAGADRAIIVRQDTERDRLRT